MQLFIICFFLFLSYSFNFQILVAAKSRCNHQAELSALLQFKEGFQINCIHSYNMSYPKTSSWKNGAAEWDGVECDPVTGQVIGLDLSSSCLHGSINSNSNSIFSHLVHLEHLNLAFNNFKGSSIPAKLGNLSRLRYLNLSSSYFDGRVPLEISKLSMLTSLDLSYNSQCSDMNLRSRVGNCGLKGEFPPGIFHLPKLQHLILQGNVELEGHIPTDFNLSTNPLLESLLLGWTNFSGTVPDSIGKLVLLRELDLSSTEISGSFPVSIGNLLLLRELDLSNTKFSGPFPVTIGNLLHLRKLNLPNTKFSGPIPVSIGNLVSLRELDLSLSTFSGPIPASLGKLSKLNYLNFHGASLTGDIPYSLANLTDLSVLDLSQNRLTGQIPSFLSTQLSQLLLADNQLTGEIPPGFVNLTKLIELDLRNNKLHGPLPIQNMTVLRFLDVSDNKLYGSLQIQNLRSLASLHVSNNKLNGTLEIDTILELSNLTDLVLSSNNLTLLQRRNVSVNSTHLGFVVLELSSCRLNKFPEFLMHQHWMIILDLSYNNIEGPIPKWMGSSLKSLTTINLSHNFITGFDDPYLFLQLPSLGDIDISFNKLRGSAPIPSAGVYKYRASNNELTGEIPRSFCNFTSLEVLDFSSNRLTGELDPHCLRKYRVLVLKLRNNSFHGEIPHFCANGSDSVIRMIDLNSNQFRGKIPRSLANCAGLEFFDAGNNFINDTFPYWLGSLSELKVLILNDNALHGSLGTMPNISKGGYWFPQLIIIDISRNNLSGNLTSWHLDQWIAMKTADLRNASYMGQYMSGYVFRDTFYEYSLTMYNKGIETEYSKIFTALINIDLSSNQLEGEIPSTIGDLRGLHLLNLSNNHLDGHIPSSLGNLKKLESLDLSSNRLSGKLPQQLVGLDFLGAFNVSCNNLTGLIPQGQHFDTFSNMSYLENPGLCGKPLSRKCERNEQPPAEMVENPDWFWENFNGKILWMVVSIGFGGGLVVGVAVENLVDWRMLILCWRSRYRREE